MSPDTHGLQGQPDPPALAAQARDDGRMTTLRLTDTTIERIILALQVMATERTEPEAERAAYTAALKEVGEACRAT